MLTCWFSLLTAVAPTRRSRCGTSASALASRRRPQDLRSGLSTSSLSQRIKRASARLSCRPETIARLLCGGRQDLHRSQNRRLPGTSKSVTCVMTLHRAEQSLAGWTDSAQSSPLASSRHGALARKEGAQDSRCGLCRHRISARCLDLAIENLRRRIPCHTRSTMRRAESSPPSSTPNTSEKCPSRSCRRQAVPR